MPTEEKPVSFPPLEVRGKVAATILEEVRKKPTQREIDVMRSAIRREIDQNIFKKAGLVHK